PWAGRSFSMSSMVCFCCEGYYLAGTDMPSRRDFLQQSALAAGALAAFDHVQSPPTSSLVDLTRPPDSVSVQVTPASERSLRRVREGRWEDSDIAVALTAISGALRVQLSSPTTGVRRIRLRWNTRLDSVRSILGDAWERGYGDLEWRGFVPDRVMPWYIATSDGSVTHAYGVRTGAKALCFWQVDPQGITLWADVRSGGVGVELGTRVLTVCEVVTRQG